MFTSSCTNLLCSILKRLDQSTLNHTDRTPAKAAGPGFPPACTGASLSRLQRSGLSPPHPAWEARGTRAPAVGTEGFQTRRTCSPCLRGPATPWPKPSGQSNQPGQVWAGMFGTAVMPPRPQLARLPATGVPSVARHSVAPPQKGSCITRGVALGLLFAGAGHPHPQQR